MIIVKMALGAVLVLAIHLVSLSKSYLLASLIPLFPTFTLIAHYSVATNKGAESLQSTILFGIFAILPYLAYLVSMYFLVEKYTLKSSLTYSTGSWVVVAAALIYIWPLLTAEKQITEEISDAAILSASSTLATATTAVSDLSIEVNGTAQESDPYPPLEPSAEFLTS